jgi:hypothetical protein
MEANAEYDCDWGCSVVDKECEFRLARPITIQPIF